MMTRKNPVRSVQTGSIYGKMFLSLVCLSMVHILQLPCAQAIQTERWTAHTSARQVVALATEQEAIWAASSGGIFRYSPATGELDRYTVTEGLHDVQTRAIAYDAGRHAIWIGYVDGILGRLDLETGEVDTFFDIQRSERFPSSNVNRLQMQGDSLLVMTSFGLVIFDPIRQEVRDTYSHLGNFTPAIAVHDALIAPLSSGAPGLWLATDQGVAYAELGATNLRDPSVWSVETISSFQTREVYSIALLEGKVYVGTDLGLFQRETNGVYTRFTTTSRRVIDLVPLSDRLLLAIDQFKLYAVFSFGGSSLLAEGYADLNAIAVGPDETIWLGDIEQGLNQLGPPIGNDRPPLITGDIFPAEPFDSPFGDLAVDAGGNIWATAVESIVRAGFYRLDTEGQWTNFTGRFRTDLEGIGNFHDIHSDAMGNTWAASRGRGLVQVASDNTLTIHNHLNSSLQPAAGERDFVIAGGVDSEEDGTLWVTNTGAAQPLHVRTPGGDWQALPAPRCDNFLPTTALGSMFIDSFGIKWILVLESGNFRLTRGILVLDTGSDPTDPADDACQFIGQEGGNGRGLPSTRIFSIAEDLSGRIWVGTDEGPAFFLGSSLAASDPLLEASWPIWEDISTRPPYALLGLQIYDMVADPSNGVWMATNEGVFLLEGNGGFTVLQRFTASNSPLFSDLILTVAINGQTGHVYFGTDQGLISYRGDAVNAVSQPRDLFIYPNPVNFRENEIPDIYIEGLVEETEIRVIAVQGEPIVTFNARGGRAVWNGRDQRGQPVPSGVYFVVAIGQNGEGIALGKVAIIR